MTSLIGLGLTLGYTLEYLVLSHLSYFIIYIDKKEIFKCLS